jgi:hypothetical protein
VLGIDATPDRVQISPCAAGLTHAQGAYPHPRGDISVAWRVDGGDFHLDVEMPEGLAHDAHPGATFAHLRPRVNVRTRSG